MRFTNKTLKAARLHSMIGINEFHRDFSPNSVVKLSDIILGEDPMTISCMT